MQNNQMPSYRVPSVVFDAAIKKGVLSTNPREARYAGNYMYMGDCKEGAMFKNINTREYLPSVQV